MKQPMEAIEQLKNKWGKRGSLAFVSAFLLGLLTHLPVMLSDIPNHDGLASMYFDQNMITSGRWFLTVACGFSSYFTVPWIIGLIGLCFLGLTSVVLADLLELKSNLAVVLCSGILVTFPALASTFAYVFTLDGYMMALLLAVLAVYLTKRAQWGFLPGALCLAFSLGIYQAYLPFAILLCMYLCALLFADGGWKKARKETLTKVGSYLGMGVLGFASYYVILRVLLLIQGKELASYQGIGQAGADQGEGLMQTLRAITLDFWSFTLRGHVLYQNLFSGIALAVLGLLFVIAILALAVKRGWLKQVGFYLIMIAIVICLPIATSCIRLVSPDLTYHLLMRYQWALFPIVAIAFFDRHGEEAFGKESTLALSQWALLIAGIVLVFCYGLADNIGYSNLEKKYEKTYAYCVRLLDRIEQTEGYYQGIPVALIGVVGEDAFPETDLTGKVTGSMIGLSGDYLLYTSENYEAFIKNYLGATLNLVDVPTMGEIYYTDEYVAMESFPGPTSTKVVDGILYVKTENQRRD